MSAREAAHEAACAAWDDAGKKSRVDGLAARIRGSGKPAKTQAQRSAERSLMVQRAQAAYRPRYIPFVDDSSYFPHQGPRECARRRRQVSATKETGFKASF
jgi:hypothetical protein